MKNGWHIRKRPLYTLYTASLSEAVTGGNYHSQFVTGVYEVFECASRQLQTGFMSNHKLR
jgi:hypothetical protein